MAYVLSIVFLYTNDGDFRQQVCHSFLLLVEME